MTNHLRKFSFCGLRRLNPFESHKLDPRSQWRERRTWYELGTINIFIGANGAGKSTVLELVDLVRAPGRLAHLGRENKTQNSLTAFEMCFEQGDTLMGEIMPHSLDGKERAANIGYGTNPIDIQFVRLLGIRPDGGGFLFERNISKLELDPESIADITLGMEGLGPAVSYFDDTQQVQAEQLVNELNLAREHLRGILSCAEYLDSTLERSNLDEETMALEESALRTIQEKPFVVIDAQRLGVYLSDDARQYNHVHLRSLPSGWRRLASILAWLRACPRGSVCLIEEPETHLHPRLQRYLAKAMSAITVPNDLQLLIATHSSVFQQPSAWALDTHVFEARADGLARLDDAWRVLDELGLRGADISQSNGIIWVEGASDRIYIKHWLTLYCEKYGLLVPVENRDYSFSLYGGAALSHFGVEELDAFISMLRINRNMAIVIDRDDDFIATDAGELICTKRSSAKSRVIASLDRLNLPCSHVWITDGYTIESYLPEEFQSVYFDQDGTRLSLKPHKRKVDAATKYIKAFLDWEDCTDHVAPIEQHIRCLHELIEKWGH